MNIGRDFCKIVFLHGQGLVTVLLVTPGGERGRVVRGRDRGHGAMNTLTPLKVDSLKVDRAESRSQYT